MAVPSSPPISLQDIIDEVGVTSLVQNNLLFFAGLFPAASHPVSILDYLGASAPIGGSASHSNIDAGAGLVDFNGNVTNPGGADGAMCSARIQYDSNSGFTSPFTTSTKTIIDGGANNLDWNNVDYTTQGTGTIYYRLEYWNIFNTGGHNFSSTQSFTPCQAPGSCSAVDSGFGGIIQVTWSDPSTGNPSNGYDLQYRVDGGPWNTLTSPSSTSNSYNHNGCGSIYTSSNIVEYRIRAKCIGANSPWIISNGVQPTSC